MNVLQPAQAGAQLLSLIVFATMARWYVAPLLKTLGRADALIPLLWVHVFRYVALQAFSAQRDGFPISDGGLMEIAVGDVAGMVIAFTAIVAPGRTPQPRSLAMSAPHSRAQCPLPSAQVRRGHRRHRRYRQGVGKEIARGLARKGPQVIIVGRNGEKGARAQQELRASTQNRDVDFLQADLARVAESSRLAEELRRRWPALHYLVHSAGIVQGVAR